MIVCVFRKALVIDSASVLNVNINEQINDVAYIEAKSL